MQFAINRSNLVDALKASVEVSGSQALAVLSNVKLETEGDKTLIITGTNLDVTVIRRVECQVKISGRVTVPARFFLSAVSAMSAPDVDFQFDGGDGTKAKLTGGDSSFKMATLPADSFPQPDSIKEKPVEIDGDKFVSALKKVCYSACQDDTRRALKGVNINITDGRMTLVATDGRRLSLVDGESFGTCANVQFTLPDIAVKYALKVFGQKSGEKLSLSVNANGAMFATEKSEIHTKLVSDPYPNYKNVIPAERKYTVSVDRQQLLDAVRLVSVSVENESPRVTLDFSANVLTVQAVNSDVSDAKSAFPIKYDGERITIGITPRYLTDVLNCLDEDAINLRFSDATSPLRVDTDGGSFLAVIMPIRFV